MSQAIPKVRIKMKALQNLAFQKSNHGSRGSTFAERTSSQIVKVFKSKAAPRNLKARSHLK